MGNTQLETFEFKLRNREKLSNNSNIYQRK